jgi:lipoate synthase
LDLSGSEFASAEELVNALNNQGNNKQVSINEQIKKQTTETKLTALYSNWKKENDSIEKIFESQQKSIQTNGGQNAKQW